MRSSFDRAGKRQVMNCVRISCCTFGPATRQRRKQFCRSINGELLQNQQHDELSSAGLRWCFSCSFINWREKAQSACGSATQVCCGTERCVPPARVADRRFDLKMGKFKIGGNSSQRQYGGDAAKATGFPRLRHRKHILLPEFSGSLFPQYNFPRLQTLAG